MQRLLARSKSKGTLKAYSSSISSWLEFATLNNLPTNPSTAFGVAKFITHLADSNASFSSFAKVKPALSFLHECQNHSSSPATEAPFVQLVLSGAKREAAERRGPVQKADVLSQKQIHTVVDQLWKKGVGVIDTDVKLSTWRTVVRIYTTFKTLCRNDCYTELLSSDIIFAEDHVQLNFARAKNDQFYEGSI